MNEDNISFRLFARNLETALTKYDPKRTKELLEHQRMQIRALLKLESKFRRALLAHKWGPGVYEKFVDYINDSKRSILAARPYFRERQTVFTAHISGALKNRKHRVLHHYRLNYGFIRFAVAACKWGKNSDVVKISKEIEKLREEICEQNTPLAISQARMFYAVVPKGHLTWMDQVQIHCGGLLTAIDKFVPPDTTGMSFKEELQAYRSFRAVAIGRMISDRLEATNETMLHFYPTDKKKIYRANKMLRSFGDHIDWEKMAEHVNIDIDVENQRTNSTEIADLVAGATMVSGDAVAEGMTESILDRATDTDVVNSNVEFEDAVAVMHSFIGGLSDLHQKILRLKGISSENNNSKQQPSHNPFPN